MKQLTLTALIYCAFCIVSLPGNANDLPIAGLWGDDLRCFGHHRKTTTFTPFKVSTEPWTEQRDEQGEFRCSYSDFKKVSATTWKARRRCRGGPFNLMSAVEHSIEAIDENHITIRTDGKIYWSAATALKDTEAPVEERLEQTAPETYDGLRRCDQADIRAAIAHHFPPNAIQWTAQSRTAQAIYLLRYSEHAAEHCKFELNKKTRADILERITSGLTDAFRMETVFEIQEWSKNDHDSDRPYPFFCKTLYDRIGPKGSVLPDVLLPSRDYDTY